MTVACNLHIRFVQTKNMIKLRIIKQPVTINLSNNNTTTTTTDPIGFGAPCLEEVMRKQISHIYEFIWLIMELINHVLNNQLNTRTHIFENMIRIIDLIL